MTHFLAKKPLDDSLADAERISLRRALGPVQLTLIGIGATIGAGIFATIGTAAAGDALRPGAGPGLMLSFVIAGAVCALVALCYAELASMVPIAGSAYTYSYVTLGEIVAWVIGWDLIIEYAVGNVAVAISWANYTKTLFRSIGIEIPDWLSIDLETARHIPGVLENAPHLFGVPIVCNLLAASITVILTGVLLIGIRESAWLNAAMVLFKLVVLSFFVLVGARYFHVEHWHPFLPNGMQGALSGAAIVFFAFIGFDAVSTVAEETKNPSRDLPIGILGSLVVCTFFYVVVAAIFTGLIPYPDLVRKLAAEKSEPLTVALEYVNAGGFVILLVALGSVVAHTAVLFVFQLGQTRIFFSMARDGLLPPVFARVSEKFRTPWGATIVTGLAVAIASMFTTLEEMVDLTNIGTLFAFILVCLGVMVLRKTDPGRRRSFRVPGGNFIPLLAIAGCLGLIVYLPPASWLRFAAWLNIGFVVYANYGIFHSRLTGIERSSRGQAIAAQRGALLGIAGAMLLAAAQGADALRSGNFHRSLWLTVPLWGNFFLLYLPVVSRSLRILRANASHDERRYVLQALLIVGSLTFLSGLVLSLTHT